MKYRCQSAHKLVELNQHFSFIPNYEMRRRSSAPLPWCHTVLDLAAAPGGFSQVAVELMQAQREPAPVASAGGQRDVARSSPLAPTVLAFDQRAIEPLPHVTTFKGSLLNHSFVSRAIQPHLERRQKELRQAGSSSGRSSSGPPLTLSGVLHDSVSVVKGQRAFSVMYAQSQMVLSTLLLAGTLFLKWNTTASAPAAAAEEEAPMPVFYVTKAMRCAHLKQLREVLSVFFSHVHLHKPQSSRDESREMYFVCSGFRSRRFSRYKTSREMATQGGRQKARQRNLFSLAPTADDVGRPMQDTFVWHCLGCGQQRVGCSPCPVCCPC